MFHPTPDPTITLTIFTSSSVVQSYLPSGRRLQVTASISDSLGAIATASASGLNVSRLSYRNISVPMGRIQSALTSAVNTATNISGPAADQVRGTRERDLTLALRLLHCWGPVVRIEKVKRD